MVSADIYIVDQSKWSMSFHVCVCVCVCVLPIYGQARIWEMNDVVQIMGRGWQMHHVWR